MQLEAVLWWQNRFGVILSQLLKHRYHVMHIRLSDKHNFPNHFCLQAFLSEQFFPSLSISCCSSAVILLFFKVSQRLARTSIRLLISFRATLKVFFCQQALSMRLITLLSRASTGIQSKEVFKFNHRITDHVSKSS